MKCGRMNKWLCILLTACMVSANTAMTVPAAQVQEEEQESTAISAPEQGQEESPEPLCEESSEQPSEEMSEPSQTEASEQVQEPESEQPKEEVTEQTAEESEQTPEPAIIGEDMEEDPADLEEESADETEEPVPSEEIRLYFSTYETVKPDEAHPASYQISLPVSCTGTPVYTVTSGETVKVSDSGLIEIQPIIWYAVDQGGYTLYYSYPVDGCRVVEEYQAGSNVVQVACDEYVKEYHVEVCDYTNITYTEALNAIAEEVIIPGLSQTETLEKITRYVAENYNYDYQYSSAKGMVLNGGGDCWASCSLIGVLCEKAGIEYHWRDSSNYPGSGSGHYNIIARADGRYYICEAGFSMDKPRMYEFYEESDGCYTEGSTLIQYDGFESDVVFPESVNGVEITTLRNSYHNTLFNKETAYNIHTVSIPKTVTDIEAEGFIVTDNVTEVYIAEENPAYKDIDGVVYTKDGTKLVLAPSGKTEVVLPDGLTTIGWLSMAKNHSSKIVLPDTVTTIEEGAFFWAQTGEVVIPASVTEIHENAFVNASSELVIVGFAGSYAETFATAHNIRFKEIEYVKLAAASVAFDDVIGLNYKMEIPDALFTDGAYMQIDFHGETKKALLSELPKNTKGQSVYSVSVWPKLAHEEVVVSFYDGNGNRIPAMTAKGVNVTTGHHYSVAAYCEAIRSASSDEEMKDLAMKLEQYCSYAQKYLQYDPDKVECTLDLSGVATADTAAFAGKTEGSVSGLSLSAVSFSFEEASEVNLKFRLAEGASAADYSFEIDGRSVNAQIAGDRCVVTIEGIKAPELGIFHKVTVKDKNDSVLTVNVCGLSYAHSILKSSSSSQEARDVVRALFLYYEAAKTKFMD